MRIIYPLQLLLATVLLTGLASCEKDDTQVRNLNEDGLAIPEVQQVSLPLRFEQGLVAFDDTEQFQDAILTLQEYNGPDIDAWTEQLPIKTLHALKGEVEERGLGGVPDGIAAYYFGEGAFGETTLLNVSQMMAKFLSEDGIVKIGDRLSFVTRYYQVSTSSDRLEEFRQAIRSGATLDGFDVNLDKRNAQLAGDLNSREKIIGVPCGVINIARIYSGRSTNTDGDRRHAMYFEVESFSEPRSQKDFLNDCSSLIKDCGIANASDNQAIAWQAISLRSVSYKGRTNRYNTRHYFSWQVQWTDLDNGDAHVQEFKSSPWGKDEEQILMLTRIRGTSTPIEANQIEYTLTSVNRGYGNGLPNDGTWGTHRGMGAGHKIRWTCL